MIVARNAPCLAQRSQRTLRHRQDVPGNESGVKRSGAAVLALRGNLSMELIIAQV